MIKYFYRIYEFNFLKLRAQPNPANLSQQQTAQSQLDTAQHQPTHNNPNTSVQEQNPRDLSNQVARINPENNPGTGQINT